MLRSPKARQIMITGTDHLAVMKSIRDSIGVMTHIWRPSKYLLCRQEEPSISGMRNSLTDTQVAARGIFTHQILSLILASETGQNLNSNMSGSARIRISWTTIRKNICAGCSLVALPSFMHRSFVNFHNSSIER